MVSVTSANCWKGDCTASQLGGWWNAAAAEAQRVSEMHAERRQVLGQAGGGARV